MKAVLNIIALVCVAIWAYGYFTGADETIHILLLVAAIALGFRIIIEEKEI